MNTREVIHKALIELCEEVEQIVSDRIRKYGVNPRVGRNTLIGSDLEKSIEVRPTEDGIALQIASYWEFVSRGWEHTGRYPNTMAAFIKNVDDWVTRKNIRFGNLNQAQIVFLITRSIFERGIVSRPFLVYDEEGNLEKMIPELKKTLDEWFDKLIDNIFNELDKYFNQ